MCGRCVPWVKGKINAVEWMKAVCDTDMGGGVGGEVMPGSSPAYARCVAKENADKARGRLSCTTQTHFIA